MPPARKIDVHPVGRKKIQDMLIVWHTLVGGIVIKIQSTGATRKIDARFTWKGQIKSPTDPQSLAHGSQCPVRLQAVFEIVRADDRIALAAQFFNFRCEVLR
jgi:hypothetical protein